MKIILDTEKNCAEIKYNLPVKLEDIYKMQVLLDDLLCNLIEENQKHNIVMNAKEPIITNR